MPIPNNTRRISFIMLLTAIVFAILLFAGYFQMQRQLVSPVIPKTITDKLSKPYIPLGIAGSVMCIFAFLFHYKRKYAIAIIISILSIILPRLYIEISG